MKTDGKITLWSERIRAFQSSGQTCKIWCQEHHVPVSTMSYWMRRLKTLDEQSDTDMIFAKMPTEKEISRVGGADKNLDSNRALERSLFVYSYEKKSIALKVFHQTDR